jgi:hypothetical protein
MNHDIDIIVYRNKPKHGMGIRNFGLSASADDGGPVMKYSC